ncbi:MAG: hypothetical protein QE278_13530 [Limnobacter sp.]|nr:hypothetical protein [Limnobacter sp.]
MRAKHHQQQGAIVLITCVILSAGLLVTALSIQAQTSKDLYQTEGQIRIEQALQLEQAAQNYAAALQAEKTQVSGLLGQAGFLDMECRPMAQQLPDPTRSIRSIRPPNMRVVGNLPIDIEIKFLAAPGSTCMTLGVGGLGPLDLDNTRQKYQTIARIGCKTGGGATQTDEEARENCITRTRYTWIDR